MRWKRVLNGYILIVLEHSGIIPEGIHFVGGLIPADGSVIIDRNTVFIMKRRSLRRLLVDTGLVFRMEDGRKDRIRFRLGKTTPISLVNWHHSISGSIARPNGHPYCESPWTFTVNWHHSISGSIAGPNGHPYYESELSQ